LLDTETLEGYLNDASVALVSQGYDGAEFNVPSKLMNFMAYGIPVIASVRPGSEVERIVQSAECGWVTDSSDPDAFPRCVAAALDQPDEAARRGAAGLRYARDQFTPEASARKFERVLTEITSPRPVNGNGRTPH
jgi:colanic acid biosynthesis glycosyl transferase WcaI